MQHGIEEAVRTSHCSARLASGDLPHKCMGTCTITPDGMKLACPLCGDDDDVRKPPMAAAGYAATAREVFKAAGFDWDSLNAESQLAVIRRLQQQSCPGCGRLDYFERNRDHHCQCGDYRWTASLTRGCGWEKRIKYTKQEPQP